MDMDAITAEMAAAAEDAYLEHNARLNQREHDGWCWDCECGASGDAEDEDAALAAAKFHEWRAIVAAALSAGELRQEWRPGRTGGRNAGWMYPDRESRLVLTTPWREVPQ
jgi:hypothetical protein